MHEVNIAESPVEEPKPNMQLTNQPTMGNVEPAVKVKFEQNTS